MKYALCFLLSLVVGPGYGSPIQDNAAYVNIQKAFPDSVKVFTDRKGAYFEFCPDNTCDLLATSRTTIPQETLLDLGYLYLYYFSDYGVLARWRKQKLSASLAESLLEKNEYSSCRGTSGNEQARCVLRRAATQYGIGLYFVRYDESKRHVEKVKLP